MWLFKKKENKMDEQKIQMESAEQEMTERIKKHEGLRLKPYRCTAGKLSIGYGRNLDDVGITKEEAGSMLKYDIGIAACELYDKLPWVKQISPRRQGVLVEMVFNMGISRFLQFKKMIEFCRIGEYNKASEQALDSLWAKQVGKRAETLATVLKEG